MSKTENTEQSGRSSDVGMVPVVRVPLTVPPPGADLPGLKPSEERLADLAKELPDDAHDKVAAQVYRRLRLRHWQLRQLEQLARSYMVHAELSESWDRKFRSPEATTLPSHSELHGGAPQLETRTDAEGTDTKSDLVHATTDKTKVSDLTLSPGQRAYHLAVADLFVEKALTYLEARADSYRVNGHIAQVFAFAVIFSGAVVAIVQMFRLDGVDPGSWPKLLAAFSRAFTAYGLIVATAVGLWRYGKAMLDQAERLLERRHALRQGRLFVHLNEGSLSIEQMEKAFNWNVSQANAFGNISTDMQAPWGGVTKEILKILPDLVKAGLQTAPGAKPAEGGEKGHGAHGGG